jgi:hypothetical protein
MLVLTQTLLQAAHLKKHLLVLLPVATNKNETSKLPSFGAEVFFY